MSRIVAHESYGSSSLKNKCVQKANGQVEVFSFSPGFTSVSNFFRSVFLPQGYPESVSEDYLQYQIWDTIQAFTSSITGALSTQAVLKGVGVGDDSATVMAATVTWILKDGTGKLGQILFTWIQGSSLDCDCKRWRLFADIINDISFFLDILGPMFHSYFRVIVCISGVFRALVGVAGGATRAALTEHQARRNNMADVSAKDGSQETLVSLAALLWSLAMMSYISDNQALIWFLFVLLTFLHLFANYRAVKAVSMDTFNQSRLHIVINDWLATKDVDHAMGVREANLREPVLWKFKRCLKFRIGTSLGQLAKRSNVDILSVITLFKDSKYLLVPSSNCLDIVLHSDSTWEDQLRACFHAEVINFCVANSSRNSTTAETKFLFEDRLSQIRAAYRQDNSLLMLSLSDKFVSESFAPFCAAVEGSGWRVNPIQLGADEWRAKWNSSAIETDPKKYF